MSFDAVLLLSFGGPEGPDDVRPFLAHVLRGRPVPPDRLELVAEHYMRFGGRSPINDQNRALLKALAATPELDGRPLYWGNRNWRPFVTDTVRDMTADGIQRAAVFVTSAYSSYSGCRQYIEDLAGARAAAGPGSPELVKLRPYFNHPGFVGPLADGLRAAADQCPPGTPVLMTAHSIPEAAAATCDYEAQLAATAELVAQAAGVTNWQLVYQSRSGSPGQPWLGPDIVEVVERQPPGGSLLVCPIGFVSDHMEVIYDLDVQAAEAAAKRGVRLVRSATPGTDPRFVGMVGQLVAELEKPDQNPPAALGALGARRTPCAGGCCPPAARPGPGSKRPDPVDSGR